MKMKKADGVAPIRFVSIRSVLRPAVVFRLADCQWNFVPLIGVPGRFAAGLVRLVLRREEFEGIDVEMTHLGQLLAFGCVGAI
jgi:hypothetical protein